MGRLELKLLALLVLLAGVPLAVAFWLSGSLFDRSLGAGLNPQVRTALTDAVQVYRDYVGAEKARQRALANGLAGSAALARSQTSGDTAAARTLVDAAATDPGVLAVKLEGPAGAIEATRPLPAAPWRQDTLILPLAGPAFTTLRYTYGLEADFLRRFEEMETEVIAPFTALETDRERIVSVYTWSFVGGLGVTVLLAAVIGVVGGGRVTRRLSRLHKAMKAVAAGRLDTRLTPSGRDEVSDLMSGFNHMAQGLAETQARIQYLTQVSAWQGIARRLAHEIKNPLTPILLAVQQVHSRYRGDDERFARVLDTAREIVEQEVEGLRRLVEEFSEFARLPEVTPRPEDVAALCRDLVAAHPEIEGLVAATPEGPLLVPIDRGLLRQALHNLLKNAAEALAGRADPPPRIELHVEPSPGGGALLRVTDNGPGVPAAQRAQIFEPYVTGKAEGTGLGLAIVKKIVLDHGGSITVDAAPEGGARFQIELPGEQGGAA